jgi:hypothetical protein
MKRIAMIALTFAGCAGIQANYVAENRNTVATRASFDLDCPKDQLTLVNLGTERKAQYEYMTDRYGVSGCGRRATYVWLSGAAGWVQDAASTDKAER